MIVPPGFSIVTPYFFVNDAPAFISFLQNAFGGVERNRLLRPDGKIANSQMSIGSSSFMVSEASAAYPSMAASYYLYVENADQTMKKALEAGAKLEMAVADMPYGDRQGGIRDPFGNLWWVSQRLVEGPYAL